MDFAYTEYLWLCIISINAFYMQLWLLLALKQDHLSKKGIELLVIDLIWGGLSIDLVIDKPTNSWSCITSTVSVLCSRYYLKLVYNKIICFAMANWKGCQAHKVSNYHDGITIVTQQKKYLVVPNIGKYFRITEQEKNISVCLFLKFICCVKVH